MIRSAIRIIENEEDIKKLRSTAFKTKKISDWLNYLKELQKHWIADYHLHYNTFVKVYPKFIKTKRGIKKNGK